MVSSSSDSNDVGNLMVLEAALCFISLILNLFLFKNNPNQAIKHEKIDVVDEFKMLFRNKNYIYLLISATLANAVATYISIALEIIANQFDYSSQESSVFFMCSMLFGAIGCIFFSYISTKSRKYKAICLISIACTMLFSVTIYFTMESRMFYLSVINSSALGLSCISLLPLCLEFACEISYPIKVVISAGLINCAGTLFTIVPLLIGYLFNNEPLPSFGILLVCELISLFFMTLVEESALKSEAELSEEDEPLKLS